MLVRARVKRVEDLPEWAKCCTEFVQYVERHKDRIAIVDLSTASMKRVFCQFCRVTHGPEIVGSSVLFNEPQAFGCLALLDLDEGHWRPLDA